MSVFFSLRGELFCLKLPQKAKKSEKNKASDRTLILEKMKKQDKTKSVCPAFLGYYYIISSSVRGSQGNSIEIEVAITSSSERATICTSGVS